MGSFKYQISDFSILISLTDMKIENTPKKE